MNNKKNVLSITLFISILSIISKLLGFIRESFIGYRFGTEMEVDAFVIALSITLLFSSFISRSIETTLIPILSEIENKEGKKEKLNHINNIINIILVISIIIILIGNIMSPLLVKIMASGFVGEQLDLTIRLTRIGFFMTLFSGIIGVLIAFLRSENRHISASLVGLGFNGIYIIYLVLLSKTYGIVGLMMAAVLAMLVQLLILLPESISIGYRYKPTLDFKDKYAKKMLLLSLPVILGVAINDLNTIIDRTLASRLVSGSVASLNYGNKLNLLIYGIFVTAITTVIFPILSKEASEDNIDGVKKIMSSGINLILLITVPAAVGMIALSTPIVQIAFERGAFDEMATLMTSGALKGYSLGMVSMSINMLVVRVFYSLQDTKSPMINSAIAVGLNLIFNLILIGRFKHVGLALGTSLSSIISLIILMYQLRKKIGPLGMKSYLDYLIKTGLASIVMGGVAYFAYHGVFGFFLGKYSGTRLVLFNLLSLMLAVGLGVLVYGSLTYAIGIPEIREMIDKIKLYKD